SRRRPEVASGLDRRPAATARPRRPAVAFPEEVLGLPESRGQERRRQEARSQEGRQEINKALTGNEKPPLMRGFSFNPGGRRGQMLSAPNAAFNRPSWRSTGLTAAA